MIEPAILSIVACSGIAQLWQYVISPEGVLRNIGALMSRPQLSFFEFENITKIAKIEQQGKPSLVVDNAIQKRMWKICLERPNIAHLLGVCPACFGFWLSLIAAFTHAASPLHGLAVIGGTYLLTKITTK